MTKKVLIAVGGTGGHIYPAIALAKKLKEKNPGLYIMFGGGGLNKSRFFDRRAFPYREIACGYFPLKHPMTCLKSLGKVASGVWQSDRVIKEFNPDVVVGFGSYHSLPILLAAKMRGIPIILHEGNAIPGRVNRLLSKYAVATGIQFPEAEEYLKGESFIVDMPLREGLDSHSLSRDSGIEYYQLDASRKTLLVFGGSQGAFAINSLVGDAFEEFQGKISNIQVVHLTGDLEQTKKVSKQYEKLGVSAIVKEFESRMENAWVVADLVIARAGANTIAEAVEFEVPCILIPYPYATDDHQTKNAQFMVNTIKGAIVRREADLTPRLLSEDLMSLFDHSPQNLGSMKESIKNYKVKSQQKDMCSLVIQFIPSEE
ncbi:MAG: undecaprenyldiphospho-muramoylpentapeptide beta-N-acetylglucosaminyltransferase [Chlamydiota bacterium]|nr:undecaprenyldiphospho-muramoylpentapeptide beta-N-acetylglucosaminyltransferase [Chlamydiota bacterium]